MDNQEKKKNPINSLVEKLNSLISSKKTPPKDSNLKKEASPKLSNPNKDSLIDTVYKKIPAGKKLTPEIMLYGGLGVLLFLGVMASAATSTKKPETTPLPSTTPIPTLPPNINQENPVSIKKFTNTTHGFSFNHPGLSDKCCFINGPLVGNSQIIGNLSDPKTVKQGSGDPFNGLSIYIIELGQTTPDEYIKRETKALMDKYTQNYGEEPQNTSFQNITIANQPTVLLQNYSSLTVNRYYIQFPNTKKILYIGASEQRLHSFNSTLGKILESLNFEQLD